MWRVSKYGVFSGPHFPAFRLNTGDTYTGDANFQTSNNFSQYCSQIVHSRSLTKADRGMSDDEERKSKGSIMNQNSVPSLVSKEASIGDAL